MSEINYIQEHKLAASVRWRCALAPVGALALLVAGLWNLSGPPMWWDEGWTLSVARNWVERGHYGRLLMGQLATNGLEAALPVTSTVALSFRLFGVGIWQGRLPGVLAMVAALVLIYILGQRLYNQRVATGTLFVLLLTTIHPQLTPLIMGRQVLGEMHMMAFLLAGYISLLHALNRSSWWILPAILWWALGISTKLQPLPFWVISLSVPLLVALFRRRWRAAGLFGSGLIGGYGLARYVLSPLMAFIIQEQQAPGAVSLGTIQGLYEVMALVTTTFNHLFALQTVLIAGLPLVLGLSYALRHAWKSLGRPTPDKAQASRETLHLTLLSFSGSWFVWYVLLSVGVPRYLFPATFFGSVFIAALLHDLTAGFDLVSTFSRGSTALRRLRFDRQGAGALLAILIFAWTIPLTLLTLNRYYVNESDPSATQVADFFNTQTPPDALIETYESELQFLLNRPYHYPPDQIHVELNRRSLLHESVTIAYDPLAAQPDYLVVGRFAHDNDLYQPAIDSGAFRLLKHNGLYDIYERAR